MNSQDWEVDVSNYDNNSIARKFEDLPADRQERLRSIVVFRRRGISFAAISKILGVSEATVFRDVSLLGDLSAYRIEDLNVKKELGESLELFDEIAEKSMEGFRSAIEDHIDVVYEVDQFGNRTSVLKNVPDHSSANRYLQSALNAKKQKVDLVMNAFAQRRIEQSVGIVESPKIDISKIGPAQMAEMAAKIEERIENLYRTEFRIRGPNPMEIEDEKEFERLQNEQMEKCEEFLRVRREYLACTYSRNSPKTLDQTR